MGEIVERFERLNFNRPENCQSLEELLASDIELAEY